MLARVPLRLAMTDHADDEESNALLGAGSHWATRLAAKLLRHRAKGDATVWARVIQVCGASSARHVPPLTRTQNKCVGHADYWQALQHEFSCADHSLKRSYLKLVI